MSSARIFCWEPQLRSVRMDLQFLLDFMMGERFIGLRSDMVRGVHERDMSPLHGVDGGVFVVLDRWREPVPARLLDMVMSRPHMVIWRHDDLHLARRP